MDHQRRSGNTSGDTSTTNVTATDASKQRHPGLSRMYTLQKLEQSETEREREWHDSSWDDERESFPQYCMTCEKQFMPYDDMYLYCSETCRKTDHNSSSSDSASSMNYNTTFPNVRIHSTSEPRDIMPRATPSRPPSSNVGPRV